MLNGQRYVDQAMSVIIGDILQLREQLSACSFVFVPRKQNNVAHVLTRKCVLGLGSTPWDTTPPQWLVVPLQDDDS